MAVPEIRPSRSLDIDRLSRARDDLDRRVRDALPYVADVFIDVTGGGETKRHTLTRCFSES